MHSALARQPLLAPTAPLPPKAVCPPRCYKAGISAPFDYISAEEVFICLITGLVDIRYADEAKVHPSLRSLLFSYPFECYRTEPPFLPQLKKKKKAN